MPFADTSSLPWAAFTVHAEPSTLSVERGAATAPHPAAIVLQVSPVLSRAGLLDTLRALVRALELVDTERPSIVVELTPAHQLVAKRAADTRGQDPEAAADLVQLLTALLVDAVERSNRVRLRVGPRLGRFEAPQRTTAEAYLGLLTSHIARESTDA